MFKNKVFRIVFCTLIFLFILSSNVYAADFEEWPLEIRVDDIKINFPDAQPFIDENNRTQVPVRFVSEALNANVEWLDATNQVEITKDGRIILLTIGKKEMTINGEVKQLDSAPLIKEGRTFVPIRFVSEGLKAPIDWDSVTNTVYIDTISKVQSNSDRYEIKEPFVYFGDGFVRNEIGDLAVNEYGMNKVIKKSGAIFSENHLENMIVIGIQDGEGSNFEQALSDIEYYLIQVLDSNSTNRLIELAKKYHIPPEHGYKEDFEYGNMHIVFSVSYTGFVNILLMNN